MVQLALTRGHTPPPPPETASSLLSPPPPPPPETSSSLLSLSPPPPPPLLLRPLQPLPNGTQTQKPAAKKLTLRPSLRRQTQRPSPRRQTQQPNPRRFFSDKSLKDLLQPEQSICGAANLSGSPRSEAKAYNSLALRANGVGDSWTAREAFERAAELQPHDYKYTLSAANMCLKQGEPEEAARLYNLLLDSGCQMRPGHREMIRSKLAEAAELHKIHVKRRVQNGERLRRRLPVWYRTVSTLRGLQRKDGFEIEEMGRPFSGPSVGQMLRAGLYERSLPCTIYAHVVVSWLNLRHGSLAEFVSVEMPLVAPLLLSVTAQVSFAAYLDAAVWDASGDLGTDCNDTSTWLRWVALMAFICLVVKDVVETWELYLWLSMFRSCQMHERLQMQRYRHSTLSLEFVVTRPVSGITPVARGCFFILLIAKLAIAPIVLLSGSGAVLRSGNDFDLILNSIAAVFVIQLDDTVCEMFIPRVFKRLLVGLPALTPNPSTGSWAVLKALGTMLYSFLYLLVTLALSFALVLLRWCREENDEHGVPKL